MNRLLLVGVLFFSALVPVELLGLAAAVSAAAGRARPRRVLAG